MINFNRKTGVFTLQTKNTTYQMRLVGNRYLTHLYYGARVNEEVTHLQYPALYRIDEKSPRFDVDMPLTETLWEAPGFGQGDERPAMIKIRSSCGDTVTFFTYKKHKIVSEKPSLAPLPSFRGDGAKTLEILLVDALNHLELTLRYTIYEECDVIARSYTLKNNGKRVEILKAASLALDLEGKQMEMLSLHGAWSRECNISKAPLRVGMQSVSTVRGETSAQHNSFLAVASLGATEEHGEVYATNLVYSGNHKEEVFVDEFGRVRIVTGINDETFSKFLNKGETFTAPEGILTYSKQGYGGASRNMHDAIRNHLIDADKQDRRFMLLNTWEGTYFAIDEEKLLNYARAAKECGIEMMVMDDGWFGQRCDDRRALGDWTVNPEKFPNGLNAFVQKVNEIGLKFGIWIEPEMTNEDSDLYRAHPDWILHVPGRPKREGRNQYCLDMTRADVIANIADQITAVLSSCNVEYVKWDMNRGLSEVASALRTAEKQRETYHDYVLGVYRLYDILKERFPHIFFENCSSGGGRFDLGMLFYSPQIWTSDNTDPLCRPLIQYGCSYAYPLSAISAHISESPNGATWVNTSLNYRLAVSLGGVLGYELNTTKLSTEEREEVKKQIALYREVEPLILKGDLYRLINPFETQRVAAQMVVSKDKTFAFVTYLQMQGVPHGPNAFLKLSGLAPKKRYRVQGTNESYLGETLMEAGLRLQLNSNAAQSVVIILREEK